MSRLRSEGHCKNAFQNGEDGKADRGKEGEYEVFSTGSLTIIRCSRR